MIVRSTFFKLVITGIVVFSIAVVILNLMSYNRNLNEFDFAGDSHAYVQSNHADNILIRVKADVNSNSKPAMLDIIDGKIDIPKVLIRTYTISMNHEQVR